MGIFVNFTNHPSDKWNREQREAALKYGEIRDIPFPDVDPLGDETYISSLAKSYTLQIEKLCPRAVLCQGEFCLAYQVIKNLREKGIPVLAACSQRMVKEADRKRRWSLHFAGFETTKFNNFRRKSREWKEKERDFIWFLL